ncbi:MAG: hypothetical protein AAF533_16295 [Acidobacteriota bacterium]
MKEHWVVAARRGIHEIALVLVALGWAGGGQAAERVSEVSRPSALRLHGTLPGERVVEVSTGDEVPSGRLRATGRPAPRSRDGAARRDSLLETEPVAHPHDLSDAEPSTMAFTITPRPPLHRLLPLGGRNASIASHRAGFATRYPHDDGPMFDAYNGTDETFPLWGLAAGGPPPGAPAAVWVGGDFDSKLTADPCGTPGDCWVAPPVDNTYRGWRTQGYDSAPCNCPVDVQRAYYSANRGVLSFDLSSVPDNAVVTDVRFVGRVVKAFGSSERIRMARLDVDRSAGLENVPGIGFTFPFDDAVDGTVYVNDWPVGGFGVGESAEVSLGARAVADVQAALADNWFGLGLSSLGGETSTSSFWFGAFGGSGSSFPPELVVDYHHEVPGQPIPQDGPFNEALPDGAAGCPPLLAWQVPREADGNALHFVVQLSDTVPVDFVEDFHDADGIDLALTSSPSMVQVAGHDLIDASGLLIGRDEPGVRRAPEDLLFMSVPQPYGGGFNVGWRFGRPYVSHLASDTWDAGGFSPDGLGDGLAGQAFMEWSSLDPITPLTTACATNLGYAANVVGIGGFLPAGVTQSFEVAVDLDDVPDDGYQVVASVTDAADQFFTEFDPPLENVVSVGLFYTASSDTFAHLSDLQVFDVDIQDPAFEQVVTSSTVVDGGHPTHSIDHVRLEVVDEQPAGTAIRYEVSNDDGASWVSATPGADVVFPAAGSRLRWRAFLSTTSRSSTPVLRSVRLSNLLPGWPRESAVSTAGFEENVTTGGMGHVDLGLGGAPDPGAEVRVARLRPAGLTMGTYYWRVAAVSPDGSGDLGPWSPAWSFRVLDPPGPVPPDVGNALRARLLSRTQVEVDLSLAPFGMDLHFHLYRSTNPASLTDRIVDLPGPVVVDENAVGRLLFYKARLANPCDTESAN